MILGVVVGGLAQTSRRLKLRHGHNKNPQLRVFLASVSDVMLEPAGQWQVSAEKTLVSIQRSTTAPPDTSDLGEKKRLAKCW